MTAGRDQNDTLNSQNDTLAKWEGDRDRALELGGLCVIAGSASTIGMLKEEKAGEWLQQLGLPHLWVTVNGETGGSLMDDVNQIDWRSLNKCGVSS